MRQADYIDVEYHLSHGSGRLRCPDQQEYSGRVRIDADLRRSLLELEHAGDFQAYGKELFGAAFPVGSDLHRGIYSVFDAARKEERRLRLRLNVDPAAPPEWHGLHWELLTDGRDFEVGRSPETVFSRYVSQPYGVGPSPHRKRMLCVISAPIDAHRYNLAPIDYEYTRRRLEAALEGLHRSLKIDFLERPITPERLRKQLKSRRYEVLHVHGHGTRTHGGESALVLEDHEHKVNFTSESALRGILLGLRDLKLITLVACHGGERSQQDDHLSGLAGSLVQRGVPAVIAMRRAIKMRVGYQFTKSLYEQLAESSHIDAAINEARHQLYMANPNSVDWSSPVLIMRLKDGQLWNEKAERVELDRRRKTPFLALLALVVLALGWIAVDQGSDSPEPTNEPIQPKLEPDALGEQPITVEPPIALREENALELKPIVQGRIGVGAITSDGFSWDREVSQILARWFRANRSDLEVVSISGSLRNQLAAVAEGDLSALPGGGQAPDGLQYMFVMVQAHGPHAAARAPFPTMSARCEMILVEMRGPTIGLHESDSHLGQDVTEGGALEQAFERCLQNLSDF